MTGRPKRAILGLLLAAVVLPVGAEGQTDTSPPVIGLEIIGALGQNGWHIEDTTLIWHPSDPQSGLRATDGCEVKTVSEETKGKKFTCRATNRAGLSFAATYTVRLDKLPPRVRPQPLRPADANGWFNHRVAFTPGATDTASGIASCTPIPAYGGPDRASITVRSRCVDKAGRSASGARTFRYDETPPVRVRGIRGRAPDRYGWYSSDLRVAFRGADAMSRLAACATRVYRGPDSSRARVRGWCRDRAGNTTYRSVWFRFSKPLLHPAAGAQRSSPPLLDWVDVPRALGYNAQVWRDGRKILSRWPKMSRLDLDRTWTYAGKRRALRVGESYVWFVWPRFAGGYGPMLGRSGFKFVR